MHIINSIKGKEYTTNKISNSLLISHLQFQKNNNTYQNQNMKISTFYFGKALWQYA